MANIVPFGKDSTTGAPGFAKDGDSIVGEGGAAPAPATHASSHQNGGGDEISVAGLSGTLADNQPTAAASTTAAGISERATQAEVDAGTDVSRHVTPETLAAFSGLGGGNPVDVQSFTSSGTWTHPGTGVGTLVLARMWGGGGAGGASTSASGGAGGGAGGYTETWILLSAITGNQTITIGAGGVGAQTGGAAGSNSTFGAHATGYAGGGGAAFSGVAGGGGGGGELAAGGAGGTGNSPGAGGSVSGGDGGAGTAAGDSSFWGGGGGGGVDTNGAAGGDSVFGGGGGGGNTGGSDGAAGVSAYGGDGGVASGSNGTAGGQPGGGGGGAVAFGISGSGGAGQAVIYVF